MDKEAFEMSFVAVAAAFVGGFAARAIEDVMPLPFPIDLILLGVSFIILWTIMYWVLKSKFFPKKP